MRARATGEPVEVLILMTSPLDRISHALRVVAAMRNARPELRFTWVAREGFVPLVQRFSFVDAAIGFPRGGGVRRHLKFIRELRRRRYDLVLDFEGHARTGAMCFFARCKRSVGLSTAREGATVFYREKISLEESESGHFVERLTTFGRVFGVALELGSVLRPEATDVALPQLWNESKASGKTCICLFPDRYKKERAWPGMLEYARRVLAEDANRAVFLMGFGRQVAADEALPGLYDLREALSWPQIVAILSQADLAVSNDNGYGQLASVLGCRNLTLYTLVSPQRRGSRSTTQAPQLALQAPHGNAARIDIEEVHQATRKLLPPPAGRL